MSGQLVVGINPSNALQAIETTAAGNLKIDIASSGGGALAANVDVTGNTIGLSTSSLQTTANTSLATIAGDTTSLDSKVTACNTGATVITSNSDTTKATSTLQTAGNTSLATLAGAVAGTEFQCDIVTSALPSGASTEATLAAAEAHLGTIDTSTATLAGAVAGTEFQCDIVTSALPSGASTEATLVAAEAHLGTIDTSTATASTTLTGISAKLPAALGQDVMADSLSVVIASNQSSIPVSTAGASASASSESATPGAGVTTNSTGADMNGYNHLTIFGTSSNTTDQIKVQTSNDNVTYYENQAHFVSQQMTSGNFALNITGTGARYYRITQGNTTGGAKALTIITSKK